ncbi:hypothetical protein DYY67_0267 [Candidatus Nitrosotalea sp. TS]|uniref:hypothetical protein n=1 Tax=Candidatus Nitrosotalea sp. TS TaxID=2341020 RepID=UPI00140CB603|nr:hypothetical protein [Candidatus Nitrosotalea sp. TS]NHI03146.1 hypothetical protein [Candidatus Nitrosotalea sp. TS]
MEPSDFLDHGQETCPRCGELRRLSMGGFSIFCPVIQICRLCVKAEVLVNKFWNNILDQKELQVEVERQIQWILRYIEQNLHTPDVTKDKSGLRDMEKLREMTLKLPGVIARKTISYTMMPNDDSNMISQKK